MCGHAYKTSAEMAAVKGAFAGFAKNREPMLRVMRMHRDAAYEIDRDASLLPGEAGGAASNLYRAACDDWDEAVRLGEIHGYRNAQATVLAPTGTIGLLMDCDTTGIEPDFALVKFKKLAGGGYFKIVNQTVPKALHRLGYGAREVQEIVAHVSGSNTLLTAPHVNRRTLRERGLTDAELSKVESGHPRGLRPRQRLRPVGDRRGRLRARGGGQGAARQAAVLAARAPRLHPRADRRGAGRDHPGRMTIEGAPHLREEHYAVFDCANRCGKQGKRFLAPMSHVRMMAAVQPFLSGAISKTVNLPSESTIEEVQSIYEEGWRLGLKAVALYRDGCKASQPLSSSGSTEDRTTKKEESSVKPDPLLSPLPQGTAEAQQPQLSLRVGNTRFYGERARLPKKRHGFTQEARVGGHKIFLRTGQYEDGTLGEIFIDMHKEGAAFRSLMNCFAMSVTIGLQYGVPLQTYVDQFTFTRFEPQGPVEGHPYVKFATSIVDFIFRALGVEYLHRYDLAHIKPEIDASPFDSARNQGTPSEPPSLRALPMDTVRPPAPASRAASPKPRARIRTPSPTPARQRHAAPP